MWENPALDETSRLYWKDFEKFKDKHEHYNSSVVAKHGNKTIQEWQKIAEQAPKRFVRPSFARFSRVGRRDTLQMPIGNA